MNIKTYVIWYYTPLSFAFTDHLKPALLVYDCMDELSSFKFAAPELKIGSKNFSKADLVFTGGSICMRQKRNFIQTYHAFQAV